MMIASITTNKVMVVAPLLLLLVLLAVSLPPKQHLTPATPDGGGHLPPAMVGDVLWWPDLLVFAEAAPVICTANLSDVTPAQGDTVHIQAGECSGAITVSSDNVAIIIHPGAGEFQTDKYIEITTNSTSITNFTLDVSGVEWDFGATAAYLLFPSSGWPSPTTLVGSTISIRDSTITGYRTLQMGELADSRVSIDGSTLGAASASTSASCLEFPSALNNSTVDVSNSNLTAVSTFASFSTKPVAIWFSDASARISASTIRISSSMITVEKASSLQSTGMELDGPLINSTVEVSGSTITLSELSIGVGILAMAMAGSALVVADSTVTMSVTSTAYGLVFYDNIVNSTLAVRGSTFAVTSSVFYALAVSFNKPITTSAVAISDTTVTATALRTSYGILFGELLTSTVTVSGSAVTAVSLGSTATSAAYALGFFSGQPLPNSTVEVSGSSITASTVTTTGYSLVYLTPDVSTIILRSSNFMGVSDGPGPVGVSYGATAVGSLQALCIHWNSDDAYFDVLAPNYTSVYTSAQLTSESPACTPTSATSSATATLTPPAQGVSDNTPSATFSVSQSRAQEANEEVRLSETISRTATAPVSPGTASPTSVSSYSSSLSMASPLPAYASLPLVSSSAAATNPSSASVHGGVAMSSIATSVVASSSDASTFPSTGLSSSNTTSRSDDEEQASSSSASFEGGRHTSTALSSSDAVVVDTTDAPATAVSPTTTTVPAATTGTTTAVPPTATVIPTDSPTIPSSVSPQAAYPTIKVSEMQIARGVTKNTQGDVPAASDDQTTPGEGRGGSGGGIGPNVFVFQAAFTHSNTTIGIQLPLDQFSVTLLETPQQQPNPLGFAKWGFTGGQRTATAEGTTGSSAPSFSLTPLNATWFRFELALIPNYDIEVDEVLRIELTPLYFDPAQQPTPPPATGSVHLPLLNLEVEAEVDDAVAATHTTATVVGTAATVGSVGAMGAAMDAQTLAVIGLFSCAQPFERNTMQNSWLLSPLAPGDTYEYMILGNIMLLAIVLTLHIGAVGCITKVKKIKPLQAQVLCRFPTLTIVAISVQYQGTAAAAVKLLQHPESPTASKVLAVFMIVICLGIPAFLFVMARRIKASFHHFDFQGEQTEDKLGNVLASLMPVGRWHPPAARGRWASLFAGLRRGEKIWVTLPMWSPTLIILALIFEPATAEACEAQYAILAALQFILCLIILWFRPLINIFTNILAALSNCCIGVILVGSTIYAKDPESELARECVLHGVQAQLSVTLLRLLWAGVRWVLEYKFLKGVPVNPEAAHQWFSLTNERVDAAENILGGAEVPQGGGAENAVALLEMINLERGSVSDDDEDQVGGKRERGQVNRQDVQHLAAVKRDKGDERQMNQDSKDLASGRPEVTKEPVFQFLPSSQLHKDQEGEDGVRDHDILLTSSSDDGLDLL